MIEFSIPGFRSLYNLNKILLDYYKNRREVFNDDISITSCYDSFPCIFNSGRLVTDGYFSYDEASSLLKFYNDNGISLRYTFTNNQLEFTDYYDKISNIILKLTKQNQTIKTGINVSLPSLREYIEKTYGEDTFYYLVSTTVAKKDVNEIDKLAKTDIVVPDYSLNDKLDVLSKIKNKNNVEILVAETCIDECPIRSEHYTLTSKIQLGYQKDLTFRCTCPEAEEDYYYAMLNRKHYVSIDDIRDKFVPLGFNKFKISGRSENVINVTERYVKYLIKPEFQDIIRNEILNRYFDDYSLKVRKLLKEIRV